MQATEPKDSNPYVAVVAKKHRNLKKKLERIAKAEQLLAQGKVLDEEQRILLSSKKAIEKSVAELANIKQMLEEVAKSEESNCKTEKDASAPSTTEAEVPDVPESTAQDAATFTESAEQFAAATMTEEEDQDEQFEEPVPEVDLKEKFNQFIERLIKALHVYERYANVTSQPLPDTVMYFGRTLLGLTSISSFQDTLANSIRVTGFYLHDDLANSNDVIRGTSYAKLATEIDALVEEMERAQQRGSTNALTALLRNTIAPVSPTNAPATVETSTYESTGLYGSLQFGDQSLGAFNQFQYTAPSPVYSAAPEPVGFQAAPAASATATETRPVVPIAPTLPEYEHEPVIEEPLEEEEEEVLAHHHHVPETEEHDAHIEEIVDDEEEDMTNAVNPTSATAAGGAEEEEEAHRVAEVTVSPEEEAKARVSKNIRVRGDPSRAARKAEDAKKAASRGISHHHEHMVAGANNNNATHHHVEAPKTFRDRLLVSSHHHTAAAAPVAAAPAAVVAQETSEEAEKRTKRAPRSSTATTAPVASTATTETAGETASPTSATKRDRNTRTRTRRSEGETAAVTTEQATEAGKKWSAIAANPTSAEAEVAAAVGGAEEKKAVSSSHRVSAPKPARSSTGGANATRPRREKPVVSEETAHHVHVANQEHADGFQPVSRRTPSTGGAAAAGATSASSGAAKKEKDNGEKKTVSSAPRGERPPAKKPTPFK